MQTGSVALEVLADQEAPGAAANIERSSHGQLVRKLRGALGEPICQAVEDTSFVEIMLNPDGRLFVDRLGQGDGGSSESRSRRGRDHCWHGRACFADPDRC